MWTSDVGGEANISNSKASSYSSSSSSSINVPHKSRRKTMEEVWKDINLVTPSVAADHRHSSRSVILQDFLAGAFKDPTNSAASGNLPQIPHPPTSLSLSSSGELGLSFNYPVFPPGLPISNPNVPSRAAAASTTPFGGGHGSCSYFSDDIINSLPASALFISSKKRLLVPGVSGGGSDCRHKRMVKNRESAARSRARKQAYTNELELKADRLTEENTKLKKQNEELRLAMAAQLPKQKSLQRTSSAPF